MAKEQSGGTKYLGFAIPLIVLFASVVATFTTLQVKMAVAEKRVANLESAVEKRIDCLEAGGTKKAQENREEILLIQNDLKYIIKGIDEIKKEIKAKP